MDSKSSQNRCGLMMEVEKWMRMNTIVTLLLGLCDVVFYHCYYSNVPWDVEINWVTNSCTTVKFFTNYTSCFARYKSAALFLAKTTDWVHIMTVYDYHLAMGSSPMVLLVQESWLMHDSIGIQIIQSSVHDRIQDSCVAFKITFSIEIKLSSIFVWTLQGKVLLPLWELMQYNTCIMDILDYFRIF